MGPFNLGQLVRVKSARVSRGYGRVSGVGSRVSSGRGVQREAVIGVQLARREACREERGGSYVTRARGLRRLKVRQEGGDEDGTG